MKHCPNPECPSIKNDGIVAEYLDEIDVCSDCGTRLVAGEYVPEKKEPKSLTPLVEVARYRDSVLAHVVKTKLQSEGIDVLLKDDNTVGIDWLISGAIGSVKILVPKPELKKALEIIKNDQSRKLPAVKEFSKSIKNEERCPQCGSSDIQLYKRSRKFGAISLLIGLPILIFGKRIKCRSCGYKWKWD